MSIDKLKMRFITIVRSDKMKIKFLSILCIILLIVTFLYSSVLPLSEFVEKMLWCRPYRRHNVFGISIFILMSVYGGYMLSKSATGKIDKFFAFGAGMVTATFFIHMCDITSIPMLWYLYGKISLKVSSYLHNLTLFQLVGAEAVVVYAYRDKLKLKNFIPIMSFMAIWAAITVLFHGYTSLRKFTGEAALNYYIWNYIPTWIFFFLTFTLIFKKEEG